MKLLRLIFIFFAITIHAQKQISKKRGVFVSIKGGYQNYQDSKFTNLIYGGLGFGANLGYTNQNANTSWQIALQFAQATEKGNVGVPYDANRFGVYFHYLKSVFKKLDKNLYMGGRLDLLDLYFRQAQTLNGKTQLRNNDGGFIAGTTLAFKTLFVYDFNMIWQFRTALDFQLFGMMKQSPSFANSSPASVLESGSFDFQESSENPLYQNENPFAFMTYHFEPFYKYLMLRFSYEIFYKKHWSLFYHWALRRSNKQENYPLTQGNNSIGLQYQF